MTSDDGLGQRSGALGPPPSEAELWRRLRTGSSPEAREALFSIHLAFAKKIARRIFLRKSSPDIEIQDLYQLASLGLLEAIDRYDPDAGVPFAGYAAKRISGNILDGIAQSSEMRRQLSFRHRVRAERVRSLTAATPVGAPPPSAMDALVELAVGLAIGFMLEGTGLHRSDDAPDRAANAYDSLAWKDTIGQVLAEVSALPAREHSVIQHHYLDGLEFEQIAALLGLSKGRISQIHKSALAMLRQRLRRSNDFRLQR